MNALQMFEDVKNQEIEVRTWIAEGDLTFNEMIEYVDLLDEAYRVADEALFLDAIHADICNEIADLSARLIEAWHGELYNVARFYARQIDALEIELSEVEIALNAMFDEMYGEA